LTTFYKGDNTKIIINAQINLYLRFLCEFRDI